MLSFKMMTQLAEEKSFSQVMFDLDGKGLDWQGQIKLGNGAFYGVNYLQCSHTRISTIHPSNAMNAADLSSPVVLSPY
eukprot:5273620-Pyramimonas_sp.AAC.2